MKFYFKAKNKDGEIIEGYRDSSDSFALARELREQGSIPMVVKEGIQKSGFSILKFDILKKVSLSEKVMFANNLSGMLSAGLSLTRALQVLEKQSKNNAFGEILHSLVDDITKGNTLSEAMKKFPKVFSAIFISMVHAGEESGSLPKTLLEIGSNLKKSYDLNRKIKGALTYPTVIFSAMILIAILMMIYVVPTLTKTFKDIGTELPSSTKFVIWISDTISQHTLLVFLSLFIFVGVLIGFAKLKITKKYFDIIVLKLPILGNIIKEVNTARTARTLSSLLSSGVSISRALVITEDVLQNFYYKKIIQDAISSVEKGVALSNSFKNNLDFYPVMMGEMVEVGEETGNLSKMLLDIASFYENEVDNKTKDLSTIIEPVLMIIIGGAVGFFAVSMITPMYKVMDNIK